jgi:hypothetical protein
VNSPRKGRDRVEGEEGGHRVEDEHRVGVEAEQWVEGEEGGHRVEDQHRVGVEGEEGSIEAEQWVEGEEGGHRVEDQHRVGIEGEEGGHRGQAPAAASWEAAVSRPSTGSMARKAV